LGGLASKKRSLAEASGIMQRSLSLHPKSGEKGANKERKKGIY
jgi:hypothetical protein